MRLDFVKMHGIGNDYVYLDGIRHTFPSDQNKLGEWSWALSDRHFGVGGDGMIMVLPSETHDFRMRMFNADGSEGKMCGNGIRCVAKYLWDEGHTTEDDLEIETLAGTIQTHLVREGHTVKAVRVDMGEPGLQRRDLPVEGPENEAAEKLSFQFDDGHELSATGVSMGNAHVVFFVDDVGDVPLEVWGPQAENDERFPERTNVEYVEVLEPGKLRMRVWERGSGVTMACGTGACASLVASHATLGLPRKATVVLDGGTLDIEWNEENNHVYMTGPAETVFQGSCDIDQLVKSAQARRQQGTE